MNGRNYLRNLCLFTLALVLVSSRPASAQLQVEFFDGTSTITIIDDQLGDLNTIDPGVIDFDLTGNVTIPTLGGIARVEQTVGALGEFLIMSATPPNLAGTLINTGLSPLALTVTITSAPFATTVGPPLGWRLIFNGEIEDTALGNADLTSNSASLFLNGSLIPQVTGTAPDITAQPLVSLFNIAPTPGADAIGTATSSRVVAEFDIGPTDEMRLYFNQVPGGPGLMAGAFNNDGKCVFLMNKNASRVAQIEQKADATCIKNAYTGGGGNATVCVDDPSTAGEIAETKLLDKFVDFSCDPAPAWGVNGGTCCEDDPGTDGNPCIPGGGTCGAGTCTAGACISGGAQAIAKSFAHDVFGPTITISSGIDGDCQRRVFAQGAKAIAGAWKSLAKCKKTEFFTIADDSDLDVICFTTLDTDPAFVKMEAKALVQADKCVTNGVPTPATVFPGNCVTQTASTADLATCLTDLARCEFCRGVQISDEIDAGVIDCDDFDNGVSDASCP